MNEVKINITGEELKFLVYWLLDNVEDGWDITVWYHRPIHHLRRHVRTAPHRISSSDWQNGVYKIGGLPWNETYTVSVMVYNDIDTMAVKLRW